MLSRPGRPEGDSTRDGNRGVARLDDTKDTFLSVDGLGQAESRVRGSRFIALASHASSEQAAMAIVAGARRQWHDARHHCFAFRIGRRGDLYRANDDGEPGGTAGVPILQQIEARGLSDTVVVVTRYFGGTRLGRGGLVRAYSVAAGNALASAGTRQYVVCRRYRLKFQYHDTSGAMRVIEAAEGTIVASEYSDLTSLVVDVRVSRSEAFRRRFVEELAGRGEILVVAPD